MGRAIDVDRPAGDRLGAERISRRGALCAVAGSVATVTSTPLSAAQAIPQMPEWMLALVEERLGRRDFREGRVVLDLPDRADSGLSVPMDVSVPDSPMTRTDHVRSLHVIATRNPQPLVADYRFTPASGIARVAQRIRLAQTQYVYGFALMSDDTAWMSARYVSVTLGACAVEIFLPDREAARRRRQRERQ